MDYNTTCGFEPVPYTVKIALMGSNVLLAAAGLFLLPAPKDGALSAAARQLQMTFRLGDPPTRDGSGCCSCDCDCDCGCSCGLFSALKAAVLWLVSLCFAVYPIVKICWLATGIIKHVWGSDMSYLCGVAFVHDMDIVGCNVMSLGALIRPIADMARVTERASSDGKGAWKVLPLCCGLCLTVLAVFYFAVAAIIYTAFSGLASVMYIWCFLLACCPMCCASTCAALKMHEAGTSGQGGSNLRSAELPFVTPTSTPGFKQFTNEPDVEQPAQALQLGMGMGAAAALSQYALPYLIYQSDARVFGAKDKVKLLGNYALLQLNWLVPALLAGVGVQHFAGAGYMDAFARDWEQRYVMPYIEGAIEGLKENVLGRAAMSIISYFL